MNSVALGHMDLSLQFLELSPSMKRQVPWVRNPQQVEMSQSGRLDEPFATTLPF